MPAPDTPPVHGKDQLEGTGVVTGAACTLDSTPGDRDKGRNAGTAPPLRIRQAELA